MSRVLHLSDLHVVAPPRVVSGRLDTARLLKTAVERILGELPRIAPVDLVLITGDISDDGSPESYLIARRELDRLDLPLLVLPGNHDRREPLRAAFADTVAMPESGPIDWAVDLGALRIIGLDTLVEGESGGTLRDETLHHLSFSVREAAGRPVLIAMHHPPFDTGIRFMDRIGLDRRSEILHALSTADGPVRIVAGHVHVPFTGTIGSYVACTAPSVCSGFPLDLRADAPAGYMTGPLGYMIHDWHGAFRSVCASLSTPEGPYRF